MDPKYRPTPIFESMHIQSPKTPPSVVACFNSCFSHKRGCRKHRTLLPESQLIKSMMEPMDLSILEQQSPLTVNCLDLDNLEALLAESESAEVEKLKLTVDEMSTKVDQIQKRVDEVTEFYSSLSEKKTNGTKGSSALKDKDKQSLSIKKLQQDEAMRKAASSKRMQELMRQFGVLLRQITGHKWAFPFMKPVDVEGLGLDDYYKVIEKPMDFSTIKNQMEAKDGTGYRNVREIYADVRLVFKNAMKYNVDERSDVHVMAKTLLEKFEDKWRLFLPKVVEEEKKRKEEEAKASLEMQFVQEAANTKLARDLRNELCNVDMHLEELREMVVRKFRKMSAEERVHLGNSIPLLPEEDIQMLLKIIPQSNPNIETACDETEINMDDQSESTLWRLKVFVKEAQESNKSKGSPDNKSKKTSPEVKGKISATKSSHNKRQRQISEILAKSKRSKKLSS